MTEEKQKADAPKEELDEAAKGRAVVAKADKDKKAVLAKNESDRKAGKGPRIKAHVNMLAKDGTLLVKDKETHISQAEYDRLKGEARFDKKPHFSDVAKAK